MVTITIKHGLRDPLTRVVQRGTRISEIIGDPNIKAVLGYGENVQACADGTVLSPNDRVSEGMNIILETQSCEKA